jgi:hypothetical protein
MAVNWNASPLLVREASLRFRFPSVNKLALLSNGIQGMRDGLSSITMNECQCDRSGLIKNAIA